MAKYRVIVQNSQVLVAPGKKKLIPGLDLGEEIVSIGDIYKGGIWFNHWRYSYDKVWTSLENLEIVVDEPNPPSPDTLSWEIGDLQLLDTRTGDIYQNTEKITFLKVVG